MLVFHFHSSAITLIALALERVKRKIKSLTSKKSAEVLMSVAEGIHLQLQNAESHIQRDVYVFEVTVWEFKLPPPLLELGPLGGGVGLGFISHGGFPLSLARHMSC